MFGDLNTLATIWCALALVVTRPVPRAAPIPMWRLVEEVRFGDLDDGPASFGEIRGIAVTKTGTMFVLDFATRELRLFDARGQFLRVVARRGRGPGELEFPTGVVVSDDDQVIVSDPGQDRFSIYAADGRFLRQLRISIRGFGDFWHGTVDAAGRIIDFPVRVSVAGIDPRTQYPRTEDRVRRIAQNGIADTLAFPRCGPPVPTVVYRAREGYNTSFELPFWLNPQTIVTRRGTVWCSPLGEYRLAVGVLGAPLREVVHMDVPPLPVRADQRRHAIDAHAAMVKSIGGTLVAGNPTAIPATAPVIEQIIGDDVGGVWVQRTVPAGAQTALDIFDATGRWIGMIRSSARIGLVTVISGNTLLTVIPGDDDVPTVVRYRIVR